MAFQIINNEPANFLKISRKQGGAGLWHKTSDSDKQLIPGFTAEVIESIKIDTDLQKPSANVKFTDNTYLSFPLRGEFAGWLGSVLAGSADDWDANIAAHPESSMAMFFAIGWAWGARLIKFTCKVGNPYTTKKGTSIDLNVWGEWEKDGKVFKMSEMWESVEGMDKKRLRSLTSIMRALNPDTIPASMEGEAGDLPF